MYQVLYRKWRPKTFDDVSGQEHITTTLVNELKSGRINHAYLFTGSRGTGKTTCAKILAKAVNCLSPENGNPCGKCENCIAAEDGSFQDIVEMDAASNRRIDDIRSVIDGAVFTPAKGKHKVYIIDEVHMLTQEAFNALLKTLEEPPSHVIFILATTEVHKLPATIISRCQRFDFHRINPHVIKDRLKYVVEQEGCSITDDAALLIAAIADGALRDALSLTDRCIGLGGGEITLSVVREAAGLSGRGYVYDMASSCINKNCGEALELIAKLYGESKDMARLCEELTEHFRNLMLLKSVKNPDDILVVGRDELEVLKSHAERISLSEIVHIMDVLGSAFERMNRGADSRTEMETAVVKLCSPQLDVTEDAVLSRIGALERTVNRLMNMISSGTLTVQKDDNLNKNGETSNKAETSESTAEFKDTENLENTVSNQAEDPQNSSREPQRKRGAVDVDEIYRNAKPFPNWKEVVENLRKYSKTISAAFDGTKAYVSGRYILIDSPSDIPFQLLKQSSQREKIREAVLEITGATYSLGPYRPPEKKIREEKEDPIEKLTENFKSLGIEVTEE
ncbi:MAG TPA: DNA polymerase III subunit gamma/tau [Candidatus Limousia pullorum]|uniref:DNA-directed DNA polymerase n=1 Tax=Candidatus Limousia pullorum TaxID=2840860 RepID=A0A9D1LXV8_9FIRM|nr:DNA polymerase III subunit gamma/tau [Candidatus Limousia pullorum]